VSPRHNILRLIDFKALPPEIIHNSIRGRLSAWGHMVGYYRLYMLSAPNGRFVGFEEIEAPDDGEALRRAETFAGDRPLELWCGARKVRSIPAANPAA
jgi:hypothetical protein